MVLHFLAPPYFIYPFIYAQAIWIYSDRTDGSDGYHCHTRYRWSLCLYRLSQESKGYLEDIRAIETVAAASLTPNGTAISLADLKDAIRAMNNDQLLIDPLDDGLSVDPPEVCMAAD